MKHLSGSTIEKNIAKIARKIGPEGMVLLKNEDECLPLKKDDKVAVFGRCQINLYKSGTGSGGMVNVPYNINLIEGMNNAKINYDKELYKIYKKWVEENPYDNGMGKWAGEPWNQKEMLVDEKLCEIISKRCNKAIIVIGRTAGEDKDYSNTKGSYLLSDEEQELIDVVTNYFENTIILMNVSNIIDMKFINKNYKYPIKSVLYCWQCGMENGNCICDALNGKTPPSGKLSDTIAYNLDDYITNKNFGNDNEDIYQEDIFVGYRYFNTFAKDRIMFPFGFGLTYTSFKIEVLHADYQNEKFNIKVRVTNTGDKYSSKEVVQIYMKAPFVKLSRPEVELVAYKKTKLLKSGESQEFDIKFNLNYLAAYDDLGLAGFESSYIFEQGKYEFYIGNSSTNLDKIKFENEFIVENTFCYKKMQPLMVNKKEFARLTRKNGEQNYIFENVPAQKENLLERIQSNLPIPIKQTPYKNIKLNNVYNEQQLKKFIAQFTDEELATLIRAEGMSSPKVTLGVASCFGGLSEKMQIKYNLPIASCSDGPSGIRMDVGTKASQVPIGTLLACTFNDELVEKLFKYEGVELRNNDIDFLLGPGVNIHRHPLNGRNFEYFSEDPLLSGKIAASVVRGLNKHALATVKHMACNNQEHNRNFVNVVCSERCLREIYLRVFEICVKEGKCKAIMTSYNPINDHYSSSNYDMLTELLRKEWKFNGIVMTDWWAYVNDCINCGEPNRQDLASMIRAQNDLYMVVDNFGAEINVYHDNIAQSLNDGKLTRGELQRSCMNICRILNYILKNHDKQVRSMLSLEPCESGDFKQKGVYSIYVEYKVSIQPGFIAATNVYLNNEIIGAIQSNGTEQTQIRKLLARVNLLNDGCYNLMLLPLLTGIDVINIEFIKD